VTTTLQPARGSSHKQQRQIDVRVDVAIRETGAVKIVANAAIVPAGTNGAIQMVAGNSTDVIIDINGYYAVPSDSQGNTGIGFGALASDNTGADNTAFGAQALLSNTTGGSNTATGQAALASNTSGGGNTATGIDALVFNTTGNYNTANGVGALHNNTTGSENIAIGTNAALNVSGVNSNNIHIGSLGVDADNPTIRIGTSGTQMSFFVAGVGGTSTGANDAVPVLIDSNGHLGTISSSRRFKEDIQDMGEASHSLMSLWPVTFRYKKPFADGSKPIQYGLIAEEVDEVYPDLVAHSGDGQIETVKYQVLDSMLLNEVQRQQAEIGAQKEQVHKLEQQIQDQRQQNLGLQERLAKIEAAVSPTAHY
jgi:hypothetical protein